MNYYISDLHLGHSNIIRLSNRPFDNVEDMDNTLIKNWNSVVKDNDDVYILGDLMYKCKNPENYLKQLKGRKHLIVGNHDKYLSDKRLHKYFVSIDKYLEIDDDGYHIILFHYPILEWNGFFRDSIHLYGHIHSNVSNDTYKIIKTIKNSYNVGADILDFTPKTLKEVIKLNQDFNKKNR